MYGDHTTRRHVKLGGSAFVSILGATCRRGTPVCIQHSLMNDSKFCILLLEKRWVIPGQLHKGNNNPLLVVQ